MGGERRSGQHPQAVGEPHGFGSACRLSALAESGQGAVFPGEGLLIGIDKDIFLLQGAQQRQPGGIGCGGPLLEQYRLLAAAGGNKVIGVRCLRHPWQQSGKPYESEDHAHDVHGFTSL